MLILLIKRASKLIESILIGIPIPQIFLYEQGKNNFLVIDGQQRYFTVYFFKKNRFPKKEKRLEIRTIFDENKGIPDYILADDAFFMDFKLSLPEQLPEQKNKFNKLKYATLSEDDRNAFDYRTIRNIIIKQNSPEDGDSVIFEIFNRLNSGGINLKPQEIRTSLYHSKFYEMLYRINLNENWRQLTPKEVPDLNMKDVEIILRGFAMLVEHNNYKPSLMKFLNGFSAKAKLFNDRKITYFEELFKAFVTNVVKLDKKIFFGSTGRFNIAMYEAIFVALTENAYANENTIIKETDLSKIQLLKKDIPFVDASQKSTVGTANVQLRINRAKELL